MVWCVRAFAIFVCLVMAAGARAEDPCAEGQLVSSQVNDDTLTLQWVGSIRGDMDQRITNEFDRVKDRVKAVELALSSCGGDSGIMRRTIEVLRRIKRTHDLVTMVRHGDLCASACISIFLEGSRRIAALTSSWAFHQPGWRHNRSGTISVITNPKATEWMLKEIAAVDGVSKRWLKRLRAKIKGAEWWQTGRDLWESKSGVVTAVLGNSVPRETREHDSPIPALTCILCTDPRIGYGQRPPPKYLPDFIDMFGMPP